MGMGELMDWGDGSFSPDGGLVLGPPTASSSSSTRCGVYAVTRLECFTLINRADTVQRAQFSEPPYGWHIVLAAMDRTVRTWRIDIGGGWVLRASGARDAMVIVIRPIRDIMLRKNRRATRTPASSSLARCDRGLDRSVEEMDALDGAMEGTVDNESKQRTAGGERRHEDMKFESGVVYGELEEGVSSQPDLNSHELTTSPTSHPIADKATSASASGSEGGVSDSFGASFGAIAPSLTIARRLRLDRAQILYLYLPAQAPP
ncbi:hypothetical protein GSI_08501 [Ganoderma sinense ZZ0214-1]|uniref:Uncharacterized protein n=1 Tax=Ganoderma sinense ZZ0214-1 TaxID=1077348 RepID=A0A2G8S3U9_9APHY|nr:hypothetical protein GSI_08501 [Ganoderma sinense ZZ0214-1]